MKKVFIVAGLVLGLTFGFSNCAQAQNYSLESTLVEIGTLTDSQKFEDALHLVNNAINQYPDNAKLYDLRGMIYLFLKNPLAAMVDINKSITLAPNNDGSYVSRGMCRLDLGDTNAAVADFNKAIKINPKNDSAYSMRALIKLSNGDFEGADADFAMAKKLGDDYMKTLDSKN